MDIIIGALAVYAVVMIIGRIIAAVSDVAMNGEDEENTWKRIEKWKG